MNLDRHGLKEPEAKRLHESQTDVSECNAWAKETRQCGSCLSVLLMRCS